MYVSKTPYLFKQVRKKDLLWEMPISTESSAPVLYLTFDDGPIPEVTPKVLEILEAYNAKASFFMVADNVRKHIDVYQQVKDAGHTIGNHSYHHLSGWATKTDDYVADIEEADKILKTNLLRPPYGRIRLKQINALKEKYRIVMWTVLSADYDLEVTPEQCFENVSSHAKDGSIIVFHDSLKAEKNVLSTLPKVLEHYSQLGYVFKAIL